MTYVLDIETDGLINKVTKIHCLSYYCLETEERITLSNDIDIVSFFNSLDNQDCLIGHNVIRYDFPVLKLLLNIEINCKIIDTLGLSWYLYPERKKHGLEFWGDDLGVQKPVIEDWTNQILEDYYNRCEKDVEINTLLFHKQITYLRLIYEGNIQHSHKLIDYLNFKLDCLREQEENPLKIDLELCKKTAETLTLLKEEKLTELASVMPKIEVKKTIDRPSKLYKKNESVSSVGQKWFNLLNELGLPEDWEESITIISDYKEPNSKAPQQIKNWLFSLGWKPTLFEYRKNTKGEEKKVPQLTDKEGNLCPNIEILAEEHPQLQSLVGLGIIKHRLSILQGSEDEPGGFIHKTNSEGYIASQASGFTNTLRLKHVSPIVNLPSIFKPYGKEIRGSIIIPNDDYLICGSDMSSLEDNTKQHYMFFFDPDYVKEMRVPGFDPHLDIALQGKMLTQEQVDAHKQGKEDHSKMRKDAKQVNFSAVYGVGSPKLSRTTGWTLEKAQNLLDIYWKRNWSVKAIASNLKVRTIDGQMWVLNPTNNFWYSLRYEKDKFSTLNQGKIHYALKKSA